MRFETTTEPAHGRAGGGSGTRRGRFDLIILAAAAIITLGACDPRPPSPPTASKESAPSSSDPEYLPARSRSELPPAVQPGMPAFIPGYAELDPDSGLHMTGTPVLLDLKTWRLAVTGAVNNPLSLDFDELRALPRVRSRSTLVCPGYFEDNALWEGASLAALLELADPLDNAKGLNLVSADGYSTWISMEDAQAPHNFLAYEFADGRPVPVLHGFPVRAVFPSLTGSKWAKWLVEIQVEYADPPKAPPAGSVPVS